MGAGQARAWHRRHARPLKRALPQLGRVPGEMWLVAHSELRTSRRIRSVFDFLARELTY